MEASEHHLPALSLPLPEQRSQFYGYVSQRCFGPLTLRLFLKRFFQSVFGMQSKAKLMPLKGAAFTACLVRGLRNALLPLTAAGGTAIQRCPRLRRLLLLTLGRGLQRDETRDAVTGSNLH